MVKENLLMMSREFEEKELNVLKLKNTIEETEAILEDYLFNKQLEYKQIFADSKNPNYSTAEKRKYYAKQTEESLLMFGKIRALKIQRANEEIKISGLKREIKISTYNG